KELCVVYEGILYKVSQGSVLPTGPTRTTVYEGPFGNLKVRHSGRVRQAGYTRREFVQIGDARITNVMLIPYYDALLMEAIGKPVALSIDNTGWFGKQARSTVIAMRTPDAGIVKSGLAKTIASG